jgi:DNA-binding XRE family transcriptional regulator
MSSTIEYDVYRGTTDRTLRLATMPGAGLPAHVKRKDWVLLPAGKSPLHSDVDRDVSVRGYCFFPSGRRLKAGVKKAKRKTKSPRSPGAIDEYIGARMRESRRALSMTQESLGELLGVTFQQVQKYEKGSNRVSAARLFDICEVLNVSLSSMFERDPTG